MDPFGHDSQFTADDHFFHRTFLSDERADDDAAEILGLLDLPSGARILDAGCGDGRIAVRLAAAGLEVTGVDHDAKQLDRARTAASTRGVALSLVESSLEAFDGGHHFDGAIAWFNTLGFLDDATNTAVLQGLRRSVFDGAPLVIETLNRDAVARHHAVAPEAVVVEREGAMQIDQSRLDIVAGRLVTTRTVVRGSVTSRRILSLRVMAPSEWVTVLRGAGFEVEDVSGRTGVPLDVDEWEMVITARAALS